MRGRSMVLGPLSLLALCCTLAQCCDPPENWVEQTIGERLQTAKVVVQGEFQTITDDKIGEFADIKVIKTKVDCVMKNALDLDLPADLTIAEDATGDMCIDNMVNVQLNTPVIFTLRYEDYYERWYFDNVNMQDAIYEANEENLNAVIKVPGLLPCAVVQGKQEPDSQGNSFLASKTMLAAVCIGIIVHLRKFF